MTPRFEWQHPVPEFHECFPHHFASDPLVPGALLLRWINAHLNERHQLRISSIKQIKFLQPVRPNDRLNVIVTSLEKNDQYRLEVQFVEQATDVLKGQITLTSFEASSL